MARCLGAGGQQHSSARLSARAARRAPPRPRRHAKLGELAAMERDQRGNVDQHAAAACVGSNGSWRAGRHVRPRRAAAPQPRRAGRCRHQRLGQHSASGTGPGHRAAPTATGGSSPFAAQEEDLVECCSISRAARSRPRRPRADRVISQACSSYQAVALRCSCRVRAAVPQASLEQVGEQVVVAPPGTLLIQRHQEQVGRLDLLEQSLAARAAGDRVAQIPDSRSSTEVSSRNSCSCSPGSRAPPRPGNPERSDGCR